MERYQEMRQSDKNDDSDSDNDDDYYYILEDLHQAYMTLGYWEEALGVEHTKCDLYFTADTNEYADSIHLQGKYS
jgi:hypothetical protein